MFEHLRDLEQQLQPVDYALGQIGGEAVLEVLPATERNKPYHSAFLKKNAATMRRGTVDGEAAKRARTVDRKLYPAFVIKGWRGILDKDGSEVPFSADNAAEFVRQLPDWIFDEIRAFCSQARNFVEDALEQDDVEGLAGN